MFKARKLCGVGAGPQQLMGEDNEFDYTEMTD
jgi:hypothetical protein